MANPNHDVWRLTDATKRDQVTHPPARWRWFRSDWEPRLGTWVFGALLLLCSIALFYVNRVSWFYHDEWEVLTTRRVGSLEDLMRPHNEHWSTLPVIVFRVLYGVFGLGSYWPYVTVLVVVHLLGAWLVYLLLRRAGLPFVVRVPASLTLVVFGAGHEDMFFAWQFSFFGPIVALLGVVWLLDRPESSSRGDSLAAVLLVLAVMTSGLGLAAAAGAGFVLVWGGAWKRAVRVAGPAMALFVIWFAVYHSEATAGVGAGVVASVLDLPTFSATHVAVGTTGAFGVPESAAWAVLVAVIGLILLAASSKAGLGESVAILLTTVGAFLLLIGLGRSAPPAVSSRYRHVIALLMIPALGSLWRAVPRERQKPAVVLTLAGLMVGSLITNVGLLRDATGYWRPIREAQRVEVIASMALLADGVAAIDEARPLSRTPHSLYVSGLRRVTPSSGLDAPRPSDLDPDLVAAQTLRIQNVFLFGPTGRGGATITITGVRDAHATTEGGCLTIDARGPSPAVVGRIDLAGEIEVASSTEGRLAFFRGDRLDELAGPIEEAVDADSPRTLVTADPGRQPYFELWLPPSSTVTLCAEGVSLVQEPAAATGGSG